MAVPEPNPDAVLLPVVPAPPPEPPLFAEVEPLNPYPPPPPIEVIVVKPEAEIEESTPLLPRPLPVGAAPPEPTVNV